MAARVLVVDDEPGIREAVTATMRFEGSIATGVATGQAALDAVTATEPDLLVLDVGLPDIDGVTVVERLRASGCSTPVLFLTARDSVADRVAALGAGGDDYMGKPFALVEVVARVRALLRRTGRDPARLSCADVTLDEETGEVLRAGLPVELTATEFELLRLLMSNPRRVLSKGEIIAALWQDDVDPNAVETTVSRLRRKLDALGAPLIRTVRLVGYVLREPDG